MKKQILILLSLVVLSFSCKEKKETEILKTSPTKMLITHYYSIKMENGTAIRDTLKECFSCNQAIVYDRTGKEIELGFYKSNMKERYGYEVYRYNDAGHKIGSNYFENDSLVVSYKYELDEQNRISTSSAYDVKTNKLLYGSSNSYDKKGNHISTGNQNAKGEIYEYYRRMFNENGIAISENIEDLDGKPTFKVRYEYRPKADSSWTEQLTYYNDKLSEIRFREKIPFKN